MNVPSPSLLVFVGTVRGWRGIMMSSTLVPSSVCFSETWDNSSDLFGENKLQSLHMKMEVIPEKNKFENKELVFSNISSCYHELLGFWFSQHSNCNLFKTHNRQQ